MTKKQENRERDDGKLLMPKIDVVFQSLFNQKNEEITKDFVEDLLGEKVDNIVINKSKELYREYPEDKLGILDLELDVNDNEKVDIEIQLANKDNLPKRLLAYFSKLYGETITIGDDYKKGKRVIIVAIVDYSFNIAKSIKYFETEWKLRETKNPQLVLTDAIELHIIELSKILENYENNKKDRKAHWMLFLDDPNSKEVQEVMKENEGVKKAVEEIEKLSGDKELRDIAWRRHIAMLDQKDEMSTATRIGLEQGLEQGREQGLEQGIEQGREQGLEQGIERGIERERKEIILSMLSKNIDDKTIIEITKISEEELKKIKEKLN